MWCVMTYELLKKIKMKNELVSVIIPVFNSDVFLFKAVDSILNQTHQRFEILLINDGSKSDQTLRICDKLVAKDQRVKLINQENQGTEHARMTGIKNASGDFFMFMDHDDAYKKTAIALLLKSIIHSNADIVVANSEKQFFFKLPFYTKQNGFYKDFCIDNPEFMQKYYMNFFGINYFPVTTWGKLYRKSSFDLSKIIISKVNFMEDVLINMQLFPQAEKICFLKDIIYSQRFGGLSSKLDAQKTIEGYFKVYDLRKSLLEQYGLSNNEKFLLFEIKNVVINLLKKLIEYNKPKEEFFEVSRQIRESTLFNQNYKLFPESLILHNLLTNKDMANYKALTAELKKNYNIRLKVLIKKIFLK